eukprot:gene1800-2006_t
MAHLKIDRGEAVDEKFTSDEVHNTRTKMTCITVYRLHIDGNSCCSVRERGPPETNKTVRGGKQCQYISSIGRRNEFDRRNTQQLGKHLENWFQRTRLPVVALILDETKDGMPFVRYAGSKYFKAFCENDAICKQFVEVACEGVKKSEAEQEVSSMGQVEDNLGAQLPYKGIEENAAKMVRRDDVLSSQISTKLALIGQLVRAPHGRKHRWNAENRPCWWPLQSFGSPNFGATRLSASDVDTVLLACRDFISQGDAAMSENENGDVDDDIVGAIEVGAMDVQEVSHHVDREGSEVLAEVVEERCSLDIEREECVVEGRSEDIHGESRADGRECEQSVQCRNIERVGAGAIPSSSRDPDDSEQHDKSVISAFNSMCKDFRWNPEEAKLFLDSVPPMVNGGMLEQLIEVLPMSMPMKHLPAADVEIDVW